MPISPAGKATDRARDAGFTLIELLVVISIISVLALGIGLGAGGVFARPSDTPRAVADRVSAAVMQARDAALLGRRWMGLHPRADGWMIVEQGVDGGWHPVGAPVVTRQSLSWQVAGREFVTRLAAPRPDDVPPVRFTPDARSTVFSLSFGGLSCETDGWGPLTCN